MDMYIKLLTEIGSVEKELDYASFELKTSIFTFILLMYILTQRKLKI